MTREQAFKISKALDDVDSFEVVMDIMESAIIQAEDVADIQDFKAELRLMMLKEYERRKKVLEEM